MDPDMLRLWHRIGPLPGNLRLYGGTALALYLNHRHSTDFDFATPSPIVDLEFISALPWMAGADRQGGPGMVDASIKGKLRSVKVTFMECGRLIPQPTRDPITARNGVAVAHPVDLAAAKIEACLNRGAHRDYEDVASAFDAWPQWTRAAVRSLASRSACAVGRALAAPPAAVEATLQPKARRGLRRLARELGRGERSIER